ncbi:division/cell wall cluster transcriptional repressor MraZ [Shewanella corallii]|uniref:Transcriptional regulator MraZ n=2 Tax=Shewanella TaxID=22 RepID=A0ABT0ND42_9GAMM|nr:MULTISPECIES: division/cell wall cluster transcriptional repressor MraZ [Shewanella]MCL1039666.1 division/cell wall cluster transcriptional repressor MraZ [Shewanella submarina]MCL2916393.1 division/cell wall cluster transcriptional repressor MraZ [Shewanella corallii]
MFRGASSINLDAKGRIAIPVRYREALRDHQDPAMAGHLVLTVDIKSACLLLYPLWEWNKVEEKLFQLSDTQPTERALKRKLLGYAHELELDSNGRILLPPPLRQYAGLNKKAMLVGQFNKFELWDEQSWMQQIADDQQVIQETELDANERLADFSL